MKTSDFDYELPPELIAQTPAEPRDASRLLVLDRKGGKIEHRRFFDIIGYLHPGDALVFNDSRVIPARLFGLKKSTGARVEALLLLRRGFGEWQALLKPAQRLGVGAIVDLYDRSGSPSGQTLEVLSKSEDGTAVVRLSDENRLTELGILALPPYIHHQLSESEAERYQTVYSRIAGSVAAPTAGLHFTPELLKAIESKGVRLLFVTLNIGLDTFRPVKEEDPALHPIHREYAVLSAETAEAINQVKASGGRVFGVGTSAVRTLEWAAKNQGLPLKPFEGWVELFILPGFKFQVIDNLITNFHLPRGTPLMLAAAFAGWETLKQGYRNAVDERYRFYSFGDSMLIL
ncbi:S-adenosylmethionine:tRNA ribosyltransferase-isomerase [Dehalogenimonas formicexedens]|uniref:S-adenosylmethionine:tRNA ribosyltransferase-isomerase n=1 Tax=Dehalogenimonas formicexedens TaxID=1839801 RepID=A0A1P8F7J7_9CHLR|nr:tRNA preQ1(34) S-adenosylmethionine ribosyltransferase-isomerase QueA [Dehalogenimonas formicexedens]APV44342.1 S-adenosylmethionine:tRNA ribosyltransferase-isomerase [Dehalogenimonas formicexedens]